MKRDLTQLEILCLPETFNLTDGYAYRPPDSREQAILEKLTVTFNSAKREQQPELEQAYLTAFYQLTGQTYNPQKNHFLLLPSASLSLDIIANYLRLNNLSLALIEPCFDNLVNIFKRHKIPLEAIPDYCLETDDWNGILPSLKARAICLISPNNPTGVTYTKRNFEQLVTYCKLENKLLILDSSFRVYCPSETRFDEYKLLEESGIEYIVIEDSGKAWPTKELKVSILAISSNLYQNIYDIYSDFIYYHSPFTVELLTQFVRNSTADNLRGVLAAASTNRSVLYEALEGTILKPVGKPLGGLAWLTIDGKISAEALVERLAQNGLFVLPGNNFFWNDEARGNKYIRIALNRDTKMFSTAVVRLLTILSSI